MSLLWSASQGQQFCQPVQVLEICRENKEPPNVNAALPKVSWLYIQGNCCYITGGFAFSWSLIPGSQLPVTGKSQDHDHTLLSECLRSVSQRLGIVGSLFC